MSAIPARQAALNRPCTTPPPLHDTDDRPLDPYSPEVPPAVRARVLAMAQLGDQLWRCPRQSAPRGVLGVLGVGPRSVVIEWWLLDVQGELIEVLWEE